jgi:predicted DNA-binding ribbon-helix-helix protein
MKTMHHACNTALVSLCAVRTTCSEKRSTLVNRNLIIAGHRTSICLEPDMWDGLHEISGRENLSLHDIGTAVAMHKQANTSLTAAIRVFVMTYFRVAATEEGHNKAGHGADGSFMTLWKQRQPSNHA